MKKYSAKYHQTLAEYFGRQSNYGNMLNQTKPNVRRAMELPWQLFQSVALEELRQKLQDLLFLESKVAAGKSYDLLNDFKMALDLLQNEDAAESVPGLLTFAIQREIQFIQDVMEDYPQ